MKREYHGKFKAPSLETCVRGSYRGDDGQTEAARKGQTSCKGSKQEKAPMGPSQIGQEVDESHYMV